MRHRPESRHDRYEAKSASAKRLPVSVVTVNFMCDGNLGFIIRAMACFGSENLHVIGSVPSPAELSRLSGGLNRYTTIHQHKYPTDVVKFARDNDMYLVSAELTEQSISVHNTILPQNKQILLVLGHEETGVPTEMLHQSDLIVHIPMPGVGYCLNTSQTGNILLYEISRRLNPQCP